MTLYLAQHDLAEHVKLCIQRREHKIVVHQGDQVESVHNGFDDIVRIRSRFVQIKPFRFEEGKCFIL